MLKKPLKFIVSLTTPLIIGFLGSITTQGSLQAWYLNLNKPPLNPPNWIFAPVWTIIYLLIGINLFLLWNKYSAQQISKKLFYLFLLQLLLNAIWSPVFFGLQSPLLALFIIVLLLAILIYLALQFRNSHSINFYLLVPYLLWVSFATYLNLGILPLNT
jgi:tryptophan-rich sensory protein